MAWQAAAGAAGRQLEIRAHMGIWENVDVSLDPIKISRFDVNTKGECALKSAGSDAEVKGRGKGRGGGTVFGMGGSKKEGRKDAITLAWVGRRRCQWLTHLSAAIAT